MLEEILVLLVFAVLLVIIVGLVEVGSKLDKLTEAIGRLKCEREEEEKD